MANFRSLSEREKEQLVRDMTDTTTSAYGDDAWEYPSSLNSSLAPMSKDTLAYLVSFDNLRTAYASQVGRKPTTQRNLPRTDPTRCFSEENA